MKKAVTSKKPAKKAEIRRIPAQQRTRAAPLITGAYTSDTARRISEQFGRVLVRLSER